jgi:hypothetical protein
MEHADIHRALDTRALEIAVESRAMIMSHLKECEQRNTEVIVRLDNSQRDRNELSNKVDTKFASVYSTIDAKFLMLQNTVNRGVYSVLGITILALAYFLVRFGLPGTGAHP